MKEKFRVERRMVKLRDLEWDSRFLPPLDPRCIRLLSEVSEGKAPFYSTRARLADMAVHDTATLARVRANLMEEPFIREIGRNMIAEGHAFVVYRSDEGQLVMFDDYLPYVCAAADGVKWVKVKIIGEAAPERPDIER
jgi:hypothetical protein